MDNNAKLALARVQLEKASTLFYCNNGSKSPHLLLELLMPNHFLRSRLLELLSDDDKMALICVCHRMPSPYSAWFGRNVYFTISNSGDYSGYQPPQIDMSISVLPLFRLVNDCEFVSENPFPTEGYKYKRGAGVFTFSMPKITQSTRNIKLVKLEILLDELAESEEMTNCEKSQMTNCEKSQMTLRSWIQVLENEIKLLEAINYKLEKQYKNRKRH